MTTKTNLGYCYSSSFANKADYRKELQRNGTLLGKSLFSRVDSVLALLFAASNGIVPKDKTSGAAAWADYGTARNKARPDVAPLAIEGKDARRDVSDFNLAVRLASISVPVDGKLTNAGVHFLTLFARRPEYNGGTSGPMPIFKKALRAAIKCGEEDKRLMDEETFRLALAEDKVPQTDGERWASLATSIKNELTGSETKRGRQDIEDRASKACALLVELSQLLTLKGPAGQGKRKAAKQDIGTSGRSDLDEALEASNVAVAKASAKADAKVAKAAKAKAAKATAALKSGGTVSTADLAALAAKFNGAPQNASDTVN